MRRVETGRHRKSAVREYIYRLQHDSLSLPRVLLTAVIRGQPECASSEGSAADGICCLTRSGSSFSAVRGKRIKEGHVLFLEIKLQAPRHKG